MPSHCFPSAAPRGALLAGVFVSALLAPELPAQTVRAERVAVKGVHLYGASSEATLLLHAGRIERVLAPEAPIPPEARVIDGGGRQAWPAFLDLHARGPVKAPKREATQDAPVDVRADVRADMREANRKGIQPSFRAQEGLELDADAAEGWRKAGFGTILLAPGGELLAGRSALAATSGRPPREALLDGDVFQHGAFDASGQGYPATLMGYHAQLRQFAADARRHLVLEQRYRSGAPDPRPPVDAELAAFRPVLDGEQRLMVEANGDRDMERWLRLGDELGFEVAFAGGRDAHRIASLLRERDVPVVLTLEWGEEVKEPKKADATADAKADVKADVKADAKKDAKKDAPTPRLEYDEPFAVRQERRRLYEETMDNAIALWRAGVRFHFGTDDEKPDAFSKKVRTLVERGLPRDVALRALTDGAARFVGQGDRLGRVAAGYDATFGLWTRHPLEEGAQLARLFVDGHAFEFEVKEEKKAQPKDVGPDGSPAEKEGEAAPGADPSGTWTLTYRAMGDQDSEATLVLTRAADGALKGTLKTERPGGEGTLETAVTGSQDGDAVSLSGSLVFGDFSLDLSMEATVSGDALEGELTFRGGFGERTSPLKGAREPDGAGARQEDER